MPLRAMELRIMIAVMGRDMREWTAMGMMPMAEAMQWKTVEMAMKMKMRGIRQEWIDHEMVLSASPPYD